MSDDFVYIGDSEPEFPGRFLNYAPNRVSIGMDHNHVSNSMLELIQEFIAWIRWLKVKGYSGESLQESMTRWHQKGN
jgi:hypothetical protein